MWEIHSHVISIIDTKEVGNMRKEAWLTTYMLSAIVCPSWLVNAKHVSLFGLE